MNLAGIVADVVASVNPRLAATLYQSDGTYSTSAAGVRTPNYTTVSVSIDMQALSGRELAFINGLNITGVMRAAYVFGDVQSVVRSTERGGDMLVVPDAPTGPYWKAVQVLETWGGWCKVALVLQTDPPAGL